MVCICYFIDSLKYLLHLYWDIWHTCLGIVLIVLKVLSHLLPKKDTSFSVIVENCLLSFYLQKSLTVTVNLALPAIYLFERCQPASTMKFQFGLPLSFLWYQVDALQCWFVLVFQNNHPFEYLVIIYSASQKPLHNPLLFLWPFFYSRLYWPPVP